MIEALDIAYDANDDRPFWKTRLLAIALGAISEHCYWPRRP
jgi:hypothetical protein